MPNLKSPVTTTRDANNYLQRITQHIPIGKNFTPLMTLYLTTQLTPAEIAAAKASGIVYACKLYPQGATTNSNYGVSNIESCYAALEAMQQQQLPLLIHGELPDQEIDIFDREPLFIEHVLTKILHDFPQLKIVLEHISTQKAVDFVCNGPANLAATITPHHLLLNRNDILAGGIKPHHYCLPIAKREADRVALVKAATSGNAKFFLGTDSAPHTISSKQSACGCAGIYSAFHALSLYLETFEREQALDKFEAFASFYGADFYGLPRNTSKITFIKKPWQVPESLPFGNESVIPLLAGQTLQWQHTHD